METRSLGSASGAGAPSGSAPAGTSPSGAPWRPLSGPYRGPSAGRGSFRHAERQQAGGAKRGRSVRVAHGGRITVRRPASGTLFSAEGGRVVPLLLDPLRSGQLRWDRAGSERSEQRPAGGEAAPTSRAQNRLADQRSARTPPRSVGHRWQPASEPPRREQRDGCTQAHRDFDLSRSGDATAVSPLQLVRGLAAPGCQRARISARSNRVPCAATRYEQGA